MKHHPNCAAGMFPTSPSAVCICGAWQREVNAQLEAAERAEYAANPSVRKPHPVKADAINPSHYRGHPSGVECIQITEHMNFNLGNAVKYVWRADEKGDPVENLKKARWYIDREIALRETAAARVSDLVR